MPRLFKETLVQTLSKNKINPEERRNRQDVIEVLKMFKGFTKLNMDELFVKNKNIKD